MHSALRHLPTLFVKRDILQFTFFLTSRCNARCPFCFYWEDRHSDRSELSVDEIARFSQTMGNLLWLLFSGGEIYLRKDLAEIVRTFYRNTHPVVITLPTNGMLPERVEAVTEEILAGCPDSTVVSKISLDGVGEKHDRIRDTPKSFERALESFERLRKLAARRTNLRIGINTVFCRDNQDEIDEIIDFVGALPGCETHTVALARGEPEDEGSTRVDLEKYLRAVERLERELKGKRPRMYKFAMGRLKAAQDLVQRRLIYETVSQDRRRLPCHAGRISAIMNEVGDVFACETLWDKMGNVRDSGLDFREVYRSPRAHEVRHRIRETRCYCSHECNMVTNILFNPMMYGRLLRQFFELSGRGTLAEASLHDHGRARGTP